METLTIPGWMLVPFIVMLLCIAVLPLIPHVGEWWEHNKNKLIVSLLLGVPVAVWMICNGGGHDIEHQMVYDYVPFILLLTALFVTTGGICIKGDLRATPMTNTAIMAIGWALASFMGTTGAAMLLIRLLLETIKERKYKVHTVLFFIAIVANCGGLLSPLGDPPLFLLFQKGASFTWWMQNMLGEWAVTGALLLIAYYVMDRYYYAKEPKENLAADDANESKLQFSGLINIFWLLCVIASTMFINGTYIPAMADHHAPFYIKLLREWVFIAIIAGSWLTTKKSVRTGNNYSWTPILEVACVFVGIFATMTPALIFLKQNAEAISGFISAPWQYVYCTGVLSAFLDNAPTAMVFNSMAVGVGHIMDAVTAPELANDTYLKAISMGAVFFGALTYIGNGPNFMVKSIAEQNKIEMPSFFGYMIKFSLIILLPIYIITQLIFI
ncbi:MAG: sodium:proton antiporter [Paludibacteraceae bacterium]|nr:sodium:proton antiporter [Paludibacteraceae bacterium]